MVRGPLALQLWMSLCVLLVLPARCFYIPAGVAPQDSQNVLLEIAMVLQDWELREEAILAEMDEAPDEDFETEFQNLVNQLDDVEPIDGNAHDDTVELEYLALLNQPDGAVDLHPISNDHRAHLEGNTTGQYCCETKVREGGRGGGGRGIGGEGCGFGGDNLDRSNDENTNDFSGGGYSKPEEGDRDVSERRGFYGGPHGSLRGGFCNGEDAEEKCPWRIFVLRSGSGTGHGELEPGTEVEKDVGAEKQLGENGAADATKENPVGEPEEKEPEEKEKTLEKYEKVLEEKRKALAALKTEARNVDLHKELKSMQQLSRKKTNDEIFIKLGSEKDISKEAAEKEERANKSVSINEFLKPAEGEDQMFYGGRNRSGGGHGSRGGHSGGEHGGYLSNVQAPSITDSGHFPSVGGK
ncbi:putative hyaluronan/mRNA-binding protein [Rosa chinensis]|uniref:Putative hyaluronan/mRNA-binding protein n=1 Tax=Rosa chinensis TaxID=74649 RepID=A0A2P6P8V1_ROSCH|nr:RGG repeats nuclear RNA binding protein A [Rosa chinensis]PRQ18337.1 putative hyaluronan/mRNA-binding protein [Rosa chinensis]